MDNVVNLKPAPKEPDVEWARKRLEDARAALEAIEHSLYPVASAFWKDGAGKRDVNVNALIGRVRDAQHHIHMFMQHGHVPDDFPIIQGIPEE